MKPWCQFHPHFTSSFFLWKPFEHFFSTYSLGLYFLGTRKFAQKVLVKCWWNWLLLFVVRCCCDAEVTICEESGFDKTKVWRWWWEENLVAKKHVHTNGYRLSLFATSFFLDSFSLSIIFPYLFLFLYFLLSFQDFLC